MKMNDRNKIGFTKFKEDFHEIPGTRFIEKSGATDMNDNNIIKALECCTSQGGCLECPLYKPEHTGTCVKSVLVNALGLINRLYKEINIIQQEQYTNGRNDGIREFAEKLKAKSDYCYLGNIDSLAYRILGKDLDSLVKEMTEGKDENKH